MGVSGPWRTQRSSPRLCAPGGKWGSWQVWGVHSPPALTRTPAVTVRLLLPPAQDVSSGPARKFQSQIWKICKLVIWSNRHLPMKKIKAGRLRNSRRCAQLAGGRAAHSCRKLPTPKSSPHSGHTCSRHEAEPDTLTLQPSEGEAHTGAPQSRLEGEDSGRELCRSRV